MKPQITARQLEAAKLYQGALSGDRRDQHAFAEQISFSDLPTQLTPLIRRTMIDNYTQVPKVWDRFTVKKTVLSIDRDEELMSLNFLNQDNIPLSNGGEAFVPGSLPSVGPETKYPKILPQGSSKFLRASVVGEAFGIQWQSIVNSRGMNVSIIDEAVKAFAQHAAAAEDVAATKLLMLGGAINTTAIGGSSSGYGGHNLAGDPRIASILDIQAAVRQAQTYFLDGVNVYFDKFALVCAPAQVSNVKQVLSSRSITSVGSTGARAVRYDQVIDLGAEIDVVPNRFLTAAALGGATLGATAWFLVPVGGIKPTLSTNFLEGYETPSYWMKDSNAVTYGSGSDAPMLDGDFDSDSIETKVRHVVGASALWTEGIIYSAGTGAGLAA